MILSRSPYTIKPTKIVGATTKVTANVHLWNAGSKPSTPTYKIEKSVPPTNIEFEISNLIKDYFKYDPIYYSSTGVRKSKVGNVVAVDVNQVYIPSQTENVYGKFAVDGYGYFMEGQNPQTPNDGILLSNDYYIADSKGHFNIPVLKSAGAITINGVSKSYQTGTDVASNLQNIWLNLSSYTDSVRVKVGGKEIFIELKEECKYDPMEIMFLNKFGAWEIMTFFKNHKESIKTTSEQFKPHTRVYERYNTNGREEIEVNSGFLPEWYNETVKQLLLSEHVYILKDGVHTPLNVDTTSYEYKTRKNDKLISHSIKFKYAFDVI